MHRRTAEHSARQRPMAVHGPDVFFQPKYTEPEKKKKLMETPTRVKYSATSTEIRIQIQEEIKI